MSRTATTKLGRILAPWRRQAKTPVAQQLADVLEPQARQDYSDDHTLEVAWYWSFKCAEDAECCFTGTSRTFYVDGLPDTEEFFFLGKKEGRCTYWDPDGTVDEEFSGWYENDEKVAD